MLFSSMLFLWVFLPIVLIGNYFIKEKYSNIFLLISSIIFYAWGEPKYIILMLFSITFNYIFGRVLGDHKINSTRLKRLILFICIMGNISLLIYFKYFNFLTSTINNVAGGTIIPLHNIILPIGISFYTFQALSYVFDVYFGTVLPQKSWFKIALYITFFPQLIAGPIVRYKDIAEQIDKRTINWKQSAEGVRRFIFGLGKKVLIANTLAKVVDSIFALPASQVGTLYAWIGVVLYMFQIYYDFSGYSDMAIGLGKFFGFEFLENFNYPYLADSIQDFWRRWHISLSSWFKEYVYIPLGGNRKGVGRTYFNMIIVFFLTGLWHGASFNFIAWGLYNGAFLTIEKAFLGKWLKNNKLKWINHVYSILVILGGWVLFRSPGMHYALSFGMSMIIPSQSAAFDFGLLINSQVVITFFAAVLLCGPLQTWMRRLKSINNYESKFSLISTFGLILIFSACVIQLISNSYNPFIYFRF